MTISRLEAVIHVVVAKPIAWTIYWIWQGIVWISRGVVSIFTWVRQRWTAYRQASQASSSSAG